MYIRGDKAYTTFNRYFKSISAVTILGGIDLRGKHNFRVSVGPVNGILNWEEANQNHFRYGENLSRPTITEPGVLVPGHIHSIQIRQDGDNVVFSVDGKPQFTAPGSLKGTVTIYSATDAIVIQEMIIEGEPDLLRSVAEPSHNNLY